MPNCEMCGRGIGTLNRAKIEGAVLEVCDNCASKGEIIRTPDAITRGVARTGFAHPPREVKIIEDEIVEGFGKVIHNARKSREWDLKKLAQVLHAKESLMHKIESGKIKPDLSFAHKIEHALGIHLVEKVKEDEVKSTASGSGGMTLADFVKVKKVKK
ncbi:MAG: TIGR00270 family protein [Candidatus Omnitrophica bacterium]|nr:TIGR00270 family protein [Candidatus Omnitrophota bacterium]